MKRFAIYYAPREGAFADAAAAWLGWDARIGKTVVQPDVPGIADLTAAPRRYGFHGTIKPPFRLPDGIPARALADAVHALAAYLPAVTLDRLAMVRLEGFLAFIPQGDTAGLSDLAARVVQGLEAYRAPLTPAEIARRQPETLTPRQRQLLEVYGYPYVMEEFQFHLTLSDRLEGPHVPAFEAAAQSHFTGLLPQPFVVQDLCLFGEDEDKRFHLLHRYPLSA